MRTKAKRDDNEAEIVKALEAIGVKVFRVSVVGLPDLLTFKVGRWLPIEVKRRRGKLTPAQQKTHALTAFPVVESIVEAIELFGVKR